MMLRAENSDFRLMAAPLQGLTEAPFRYFHTKCFPVTGKNIVTYITPFVRVEKGEPRRRDLRDVTSVLNEGICVIPQIIACDGKEFTQLVEAIYAIGLSEVNLNAGCPFPPQVNKGRGAGLLNNPQALYDIARIMTDMSHIRFSLKMRLGIDEENKWRDCVAVINSMPLDHVTIHPRTARQKYSGQLHYDEVTEFISEINHPVVFNGEISSPAEIDDLRNRFPGISGVMIGRGLLRRPSLFAEYITGKEWTATELNCGILSLHSALYDHYASILCGDMQLLTKLKPFWEYFGSLFPKKQVKLIMKSRTISAYLSAISALE